MSRLIWTDKWRYVVKTSQGVGSPSVVRAQGDRRGQASLGQFAAVVVRGHQRSSQSSIAKASLESEIAPKLEAVGY